VKVLAIQNSPIEHFGLFERYLVRHGIELQVPQAYQDIALPPVESFDAVLVGGTPISASTASEHPFLRREVEYLRHAVSTGMPCLGICCGAQLLAMILGARIHKSPRREIGGYDVRLTVAGRNDSLLAGFPPTFAVFQWHGDVFEIPPGARGLVEGKECKDQMFRHQSVVGVLFHLEVESKDASVWARTYRNELNAFGKTESQVVMECRAREAEMHGLADRFIDNFLGIVAMPG